MEYDERFGLVERGTAGAVGGAVRNVAEEIRALERIKRNKVVAVRGAAEVQRPEPAASPESSETGYVIYPADHNFGALEDVSVNVTQHNGSINISVKSSAFSTDEARKTMLSHLEGVCDDLIINKPLTPELTTEIKRMILARIANLSKNLGYM